MDNNGNKKERNSMLKMIGLVGVGVLIGLLAMPYLLGGNMPWMNKNMHVDEHRDELIAHKESIQGELISKGEFACCLEKPCTYCIEKTPKHGEGAKCTCLEDVVNGVHPCGECIGEIMEGHGNPYLAQYFAQSIAEEVGEQHLGTLRQIMSEKYDLPVEKQN